MRTNQKQILIVKQKRVVLLLIMLLEMVVIFVLRAIGVGILGVCTYQQLNEHPLYSLQEISRSTPSPLMIKTRFLLFL